MQHVQFNFAGWKITATVLLVMAVQPAGAGTIVQPSRPGSLLDGGPTAACAAGADFAPGSDVNGHPVVPADVAAAPVPLPDAVAIPIGGNRSAGGRRGHAAQTLGGDSAYVSVDGRKLEALLNPPPCRDAGR